MISNLTIKYVCLQNRIVAQSIISNHIKLTPEIFDVMPILSKAVDSVDKCKEMALNLISVRDKALYT